MLVPLTTDTEPIKVRAAATPTAAARATASNKRQGSFCQRFCLARYTCLIFCASACRNFLAAGGLLQRILPERVSAVHFPLRTRGLGLRAGDFPGLAFSATFLFLAPGFR